MAFSVLLHEDEEDTFETTFAASLNGASITNIYGMTMKWIGSRIKAVVTYD